jgi:pilus assembly protein CpaC
MSSHHSDAISSLRPAIAAAVVVLSGGVPASISAAAGPAMLTGVLVSPDGDGVRVTVAMSGSFHYQLRQAGDRVVIFVDPVRAAAATHVLAVGPVKSIQIRPLSVAPPRAEVTVLTSAPLRPSDASVEDGALVVTLVPAIRPAVPSGSRPAALPAPHTAGLPPHAETPGPRPIAGRPAGDRTITLDEGMGRLLEVERVARVAVSDPRVADAVPVSGRELLIVARTPGRTTIYVWTGGDRVVSYAVEVRPAEDPFRDLRLALAALIPSSDITVTAVRGTRAGGPVPPAAGSAPSERVGAAPPLPAIPRFDGTPGPAQDGRGVILSGTVDTQVDRGKAEDVARAFVPMVVNLLTVRRPVQVSLRVEVVELSRTAQDSLGISWGGGQQTPGSAPALNGGVYNFQILTSPGLGASGLDLLLAQLAALSQRGDARLLARPSLVVLAGRTASLLLGGQVPVPVAGQNGTVAIEYKDFGVILTVRPDYQDDGRIFLQITPEVSTLDYTNAIKVSGFTIPALQVRRAQTMVAMRPGETLVLGGLLQHNDVELLQKVPLLGDLPVIGALFRSRSFQHQESDLVILVTPQIVDSASAP